jgi:preprotein translocase subunit SecF
MLSLIGATHMHFMKYRKVAFVISGVLILATIIWLIVNGGPSMSVDFAGGTLLEIRTSETLPVDAVRGVLERGGFGSAEIQSIGTGHDILLRFAAQESADAYARIEALLNERFPEVGVELLREETVGPKVGSELAEKAVWAVLGALIGILVYVGFRYEFRFALGAVVAILHDVFIVFGILCFVGRDMSLTVVAGLLTIAGYSINDTIVVFDRIRERMKTLRKETHEHAFEIAINETLSRTIITSLTALLAGLALYFLGGEVINDFALAMVLGIILGTYSSIYVASALALEGWDLSERRKKKRPARAKAA